jgi:hypothetical protein
MELNQQAIQDAIVAQAVDHFIGDDALYERVKKGIESRIDNLFDTKVRELAEASIEAAYKEGFEREYTKRDSFGRPIGEPTSIGKELERLISGYWEERVDKSGKPSASIYGTTSRAEWMMTQLCADDFGAAMKQHIVNVGGALKDHFRAVLEQHLASMLSDVFHVQSAGDVARKKPGRSCIDPPAKPIGVQ